MGMALCGSVRTILMPIPVKMIDYIREGHFSKQAGVERPHENKYGEK